MIGREQLGIGRGRIRALLRHLAGETRRGAERIGIEAVVVDQAVRLQHQPMLMKGAQVVTQTIDAKRMEIGVTEAAPVVELDAELKRRLGCPEEVALGDVEHGVELLDRRHGGLADPDDADLGGLDQSDLNLWPAGTRQRRRAHPPRRTAAQNEDRTDRGHAAVALQKRSRKAACDGSLCAVWVMMARRLANNSPVWTSLKASTRGEAAFGTIP